MGRTAMGPDRQQLALLEYADDPFMRRAGARSGRVLDGRFRLPANDEDGEIRYRTARHGVRIGDRFQVRAPATRGTVGSSTTDEGFETRRR